MGLIWAAARFKRGPHAGFPFSSTEFLTRSMECWGEFEKASDLLFMPLYCPIQSVAAEARAAADLRTYG
jgi:hypothetical protein